MKLVEMRGNLETAKNAGHALGVSNDRSVVWAESFL